MNKLLLATSLVALCAGAAFALPVFAQTGADGTQAKTATAATAPNQQTAAATTGKRAVPPLDSQACIRDTGSHIPPPKGQCLPVAGNSYSRQDIERTGATNMGRALQLLDPAVTVRGH